MQPGNVALPYVPQCDKECLGMGSLQNDRLCTQARMPLMGGSWYLGNPAPSLVLAQQPNAHGSQIA